MFSKKKNSLLLLSGLCLLIPAQASAAITFGSDSENPYGDNNCAFGNLAANNYVSNLYTELTWNNGPVQLGGTEYQDQHAWASDITGGFADSVQLFAWAGHGLPADLMASQGLPYGGAAHFYTTNSYTSHPADNHYVAAANAQWSNIHLGKNANRWAVFYTCRFLANQGNSNTYTLEKQMFNGTHLLMGFASRMYVDSREGTLFGENLRGGDTFEYAFQNAAEQYQPSLDPNCNEPATGGNTVARVMGWINNLNNDTINSSTSAVAAWSSALDNNFGVSDDYIPDTGSGMCTD